MSKRHVPIADLLDRANQPGSAAVGLRCPKCHAPQFGQNGRHVRETRQTTDGIIRYRVCRCCGHVWATVER